MFSSSTDRFFHGLNKRNTKYINTSNIKINLNTSRKKRSSRTNSKSSRLFQTKKLSTTASNLNNMSCTPFTIENMNSTQDFVAKLKIKQGRTYRKGDQSELWKTSTKFGPPIVVNDLHALLDKHSSRNEENQNSQQQVPKTKFSINSHFLGPKARFKQKLQQNAMKKFVSSQFAQNRVKTDRVDDQYVKKLMNLISEKRDSPGKQTQRPKQTIPVNYQAPAHMESTKQKQVVEPNDSTLLACISKIDERIHQQTQKTFDLIPVIKQAKNEQKNEYKDKKKLININEQIQNLQKIFPTQQSKACRTNNVANNELIYKEETVNDIKLGKQQKVGQRKQQIKKQVYKKEEQQQKQIKKMKQDQKVNRIRQDQKGSKFWSMEPDVPKYIEQRIISKEVKPIKPKIEENKVKQARKILPTSEDKESKIKKQKSKFYEDIDEVEQISLVPNAKDNISKTQTIQTDKKTKVQIQKQVKLPSKPVESMKAPQKQPVQRAVVQSRLQSRQDQQNYSLQQVQKEFEYILGLINQMSRYCKQAKKFYEQNKIDSFNKQFKILCYYIWQQLYYYRQKYLSILINKNQDLYQIPREWLYNPQIQDFLKNLQKTLQKQNKKCKQSIQNFHEQAKSYLDEKQKKLIIDKNINYHTRCLILLQKQFKELEKIYKKAITNQDKNEKKYLERLCYIIEMFCQLKYLNGQDTKELEEVQAISDLSRHYQNYRHLIII